MLDGSEMLLLLHAPLYCYGALIRCSIIRFALSGQFVEYLRIYRLELLLPRLLVGLGPMQMGRVRRGRRVRRRDETQSR